MANGVYNVGKGAGQIVFTSDTIMMRLINTGYTFDQTHTSLTPTTSYKIGTDQTVANKSVVIDQTNHFAHWKSTTNPSWTAVAGGSTVIGVILYKFVTDDAGSTPIAWYDVTDTATNGGDITVTWATDANGGVLKWA